MREEGSATVELVLLAPILMILVLFVVYAGRGAEVLTQIQHAADQGARAASMAHPSRMQAVGRESALRDLEQNGAACINGWSTWLLMMSRQFIPCWWKWSAQSMRQVSTCWVFMSGFCTPSRLR